MKRLFMLPGLCALACVLSCAAHKEQKEEVTKLKVTTPIEKDTAINENYVCQIRSIQRIELRPLEKGYIEKVFVDEGQFVKAGQLLFQIKPVVYKAESARAKAEVNFSGIEYANTKALADSNIVSKNELALAKAKLDKANAELALANSHLKFTEIRAPFDGIIDRLNVRLGSLVDEGELLTSLSDNSKMWVYFNVPESQYLDFATAPKSDPAISVSLQMANGSIFDHQGKVETIEAEFNNETGNIEFRATFPNPGKILRHGETGNILMPVHLKNALIIPQEATFDVLDKKYVYVVDAAGVVHSRQINVGVEMPHLYTVTSGLSATDKVLVEGLRKVKNNEKIEPVYEAPEKIISALFHLHAE